MKLVRTVLMAAGILLSGAAASSASAASVIITSVATGNPDLGNVFVGPFGAVWTTPILMTESNGKVIVTFCDDLYHTVTVEGGQQLSYQIGQVTEDSSTVGPMPNPITPMISNEMGQLANIGKYDFGLNTPLGEDGAIAAQAAIWDIEYGIDVTSSDPTIQALITTDLKVHDNGEGPAIGLIAQDGQQSQITGGEPEPASWAMMLMGFGAIGAAMRGARRRRGAIAAI